MRFVLFLRFLRLFLTLLLSIGFSNLNLPNSFLFNSPYSLDRCNSVFLEPLTLFKSIIIQVFNNK